MSDDKNNEISFESLERSDENYNYNNVTKVKPRGTGKIIAGVCSALGEKFNLDPFYFRFAFIFSVFIGIWGVAGYLAAAIILTKNSFFKTENPGGRSGLNLFRLTAVILLAIVLILIFYISDLLEFFFQPIIFGFPKDLTLFILFTASGIIIFVKRKSIELKQSVSEDHLYRSATDKKLSGVCGGLALYFNQDSNFIRLLWMLFTFVTAGIGVLIYIVFVVLVPTEELQEIENVQ